ncbi:MAG: hypothetical protein WEB53_08805 [Akkermansiaceae bacterium]
MSDSETDPLSSLLSSFALGPAWARATGDKPERKPKAFSGGDDRPPRRDDRGGGDRNRDGGSRDRDGGARGRDGGGRREFQGRGGNFNDRRDGPPRHEEAAPEHGVRVTIAPDAQAVHLIGKEVHQVARVYPLFDVAKILLAEKNRCRAIFEAPEPHAPLIRGKLEECVFLTREEAVRHLWNSELRNELIEEETIEVEPPTGNFQAIARCGISGEWLGPVNFHSYQTHLRRLHRERFANMPFEVYSSKVRTERGEEAVNAWLETMKKKTRWRIKGGEDEAWIDDRAEAERTFATRCFDKAFEESRMVDVSGAVPAKNLSPSLLTSLKLSGSHARKHPAILIPAVCRAVEIEHLPVFKRQGKLHTGPARPHPLPLDAVLAERPNIMVEWIRANKPAKLEGLWKAVLPEGSTAPPADFAADLFWLLHQGHILLFTDDTLVVQETREAPTPDASGEPKKSKKKKKKSKGQPAVDGETPSPAESTDEETPGDDASREETPPADLLEETPASESGDEPSTADTPPSSEEAPTPPTQPEESEMQDPKKHEKPPAEPDLPEEIIPDASETPVADASESEPIEVDEQPPVEEYPGPAVDGDAPEAAADDKDKSSNTD